MGRIRTSFRYVIDTIRTDLLSLGGFGGISSALVSSVLDDLRR